MLNSFSAIIVVICFCLGFYSNAQKPTYKDTIISGLKAKIHMETGAVRFVADSSEPNKPKTAFVPKTKEVAASSSDFYKVKEGDSFIDIAYRFKISALQLKKGNKLDNFNIKRGQMLRVKNFDVNSDENPSMQEIKQSVHIVAKGETLYRIATNNGMSVKALMELNNLTTTTIKVGQVLQLKK